MSKSATWMPLYIGDYLADTGHLTAQQHGAYLLMLMHQWRTGPLPTDERQLASIARVDLATWRQKISPTVRPFFSETDTGLTQKRLTQEKQKSDANLLKKSEAGMSGAHARWSNPHSERNGTRMADVSVRQSQNDSPSPSPLPSPERKKESSLREGARPKGTRLSEDWTPGPDGAKFAQELGLNPKAVFAVFFDYYRGIPGSKGVSLNWIGVWRNWCRREARNTGATPPVVADLLTRSSGFVNSTTGGVG